MRSALDRDALLRQIREIRWRVEPHFQPDTAAQGFAGTSPSTGHCAAVATIVHEQLGGDFVSAIVDGASHWFNRFTTSIGTLDIDVTADQFGKRPIEVAEAGKLHVGTRIRVFSELNRETLQRALLLAR